MPEELQTQAQWLEVIARTLAHFALQQPEIRDKKLLEKADFLSGLGFSQKAAAGILGTTNNSLGTLKRANAKKGKKRGKKKVR